MFPFAMAANKTAGETKNGKRANRRRNPQRELAILDGALRVFGERGFEAATVSAISEAAGVSDATVYEYFGSKEEVLFAIVELYTRRELERMQQIAPYIPDPRQKLRVIIQGYLEFYERNPLYTSVALVTLKGSRSFLESKAYEVVREASRPIVEAFEEGVRRGVFRDDLDGYIVRNMVLGFIEHLTIQWLVVGRPEQISDKRDTIFDAVMRAIARDESKDSIELRVRVEGEGLRRIVSGKPDRKAKGEGRTVPPRS